MRGLSPYPAARMGETKVFKVAISNVAEQKGHIIKPCADGYIDILELQAPGKKRMDARSFLNGRH